MILEGEFFSGDHLRWNIGWPTPNYAGAFLVTLLALTFVFSSSRWRWAFLLAEVGGLFLLAKSYSRGAVVAWGLAWLFGVVASHVWRNPAQRLIWAARASAMVVMLLAAGFGWSRAEVAKNADVVSTTQDGSVVNRLALWRGGLKMIVSAPQSAVDNRWMFTGREWLQEVGLYDYRNRVYSAMLGRFLQIDPIRFDAGDTNIYRYGNNRLVNVTDPTGLVLIAVGPSFTAAVVGGGNLSYGIYYDDSAASFLQAFGFYSSYGGNVGASVSANVSVSYFDSLNSFTGYSTTFSNGWGFATVGVSESGINQSSELGRISLDILDNSRTTGVTLSLGIGLEDLAALPNQTLDYTNTNAISLGGIGQAVGGALSAIGAGLTAAAANVGSAIGDLFDWLSGSGE